MHDNELWLKELPSEPCTIDRLENTGSTWSVFHWNRRSYQDVVIPLTAVSV
jgi:hypothetical protein